jgi:hypothetical protein
MQSVKTNLSLPLAEAIIALAVLSFYLLLVLMDGDTHTASDVFSLRIVPAMFLYAVPAFVICALLYRRFSKKYSGWRSLLDALLIGIPLTFGGVMLLLFGLKWMGVLGAW